MFSTLGEKGEVASRAESGRRSLVPWENQAGRVIGLWPRGCAGEGHQHTQAGGGPSGARYVSSRSAAYCSSRYPTFFQGPLGLSPPAVHAIHRPYYYYASPTGHLIISVWTCEVVACAVWEYAEAPWKQTSGHVQHVERNVQMYEYHTRRIALHSVSQSVRRKFLSLSLLLSYSLTLLPSYPLTLLPSYPLTLLPSYPLTLTLSYSYTLLLLHSYTLTLLHSYTLILLHLSLGHFPWAWPAND
jgi:hypothetical protein